ncbi:hypothetical protein N7461_002055 [Penicillium sp. DV-2018c]|nr:hypothetical protein N7461_002055 [Penicillium sp. DV-2018c]
MTVIDVSTHYVKVNGYRSLEIVCLKYIKVNRMFALLFAGIREARDDLLRSSASYSLPDWLTRFRSLSDSSTRQLATSSPAPGVYARDFAYPLRTSQNQSQPSLFSPTSDHGDYQTKRAPTQGATGNAHSDPASDYEASMVPSFVLNLFPNYPTAQGADGSARHTWDPQRSTRQHSSTEKASRSTWKRK